MKTFIKQFSLLLSITSFPISVLAAETCSNTTVPCLYNVSAQELADKISGVGITITDPVIRYGEGTQVGTFSNAINGANLEIDEGIILTTLSVEESFTENTSRSSSKSHPNNDDTDLLAIDSNAKYNTIVFEFDVTLDDNTRLLLVDYQFAAEEYNEYVGTIYNDAFGFFISGGDLNQTYNIARVIDNQTYVTVEDIDNYDTVVVNNVNNGTQGSSYNATRDAAVTTVYTNTDYYIDNDQNNDGDSSTTSPILVEYDGLTHILHATLDNLTPGQTYHFKMAIADSSDSNLNTGVFVNKISGLREPSICYDYAYKQNGLYLTAGYDASKGPYIDADVISNDPTLPVEVAMYFKNTKDSEIVASNITLDVIDINTSLASYTTESVYVTEPGSVTKVKIDDVDLNVSTSYVKEIPITSFDAFEYFYTYFSIDPKVEVLSLPIIARITYDLTIPLSATQNITINRSSLIDQDIPICNGGGTEFKPSYGKFNIIENSLYTDDLNYYYNINTQVTGRKGDLSVVAVDANDTNLHSLQSVTTVVGVDMLDLKAFHDTSASCSENTNSISDRVWVVFNNTSKTNLDTGTANFNTIARENVALRISYFKNADGDLLELEPISDGGETRWNVLNFSSTVQSGECLADIALGTDTVAQWCSNAGTSFASAMTKDALDTCMKCVYGYDTHLVCARDNFAIRPEAFNVHVFDQNISDATVPLQQLTLNHTGVVAPTPTRLNLASAYSYAVEVNATNHLNNTSSQGYYTELSTIPGTSSSLLWAPSDVSLNTTLCNNTDDSNITTKFTNGFARINVSLAEVGDYSLHMEDTSWTNIDSIVQSHHTGSYFLSGSDCVLNSNYVANQGSSDALTGCNISSQHISSSDTNIVYNDINITFHPYRFNILNNFTFRETDINTTSMLEPTKPFVYMNNLEDNDKMSVHLNTQVTALGKENSTPLSNFVSGCYAKPLNIAVNKTTTTNPNLAYNYSVYNKDSNGTVINTLNTTVPSINTQLINGTTIEHAPQFPTTAAFFQKDLNGTIQLKINDNYRRDVNITVNPQDINFTSLVVDDNVTFLSADLKLGYYAESDLNISQRVLYYYGKTIAPKIRVVCNQQQCRTGMHASNNNNIQELISYAIFCDETQGICSAALNLPAGAVQVSDIRWFENRSHDFGLPLGTDGTIGTVSEVSASGKIVELNSSINAANYKTESIIEYTGPLPYDAVMQMQSSPWLIHNENDENATTNEFVIQFVGNGGWSGKHEDNTTVKTNASTITNRRIMW